MNTNIIKVKFLKDGEPSGRAYTYYTPEAVSVNDVVVISKKDCRETLGLVTEVNVPEKEIAPFKDKAKSIQWENSTKKYQTQRRSWSN